MAKKKKYRLKWGRLVLVAVLAFAVVFGAVKLIGFAGDVLSSLFGHGEQTAEENETPEPNETAETNGSEEPEEEPEPLPPPLTEKTLVIRCAGDIMCHQPQLKAAKKSDGTYDFAENYMYVSDYLKAADLTLANFEVTFPCNGDYKGYPLFHTPEILAQNVADAGVDVGLFANNHMIDSGIKGVGSTIDEIRKAGMVCVGARHEGEDRSAIVDVNGVKVGIVAYTYETTTDTSSRAINGNPIGSFTAADGTKHSGTELVNSFRTVSGYAEAVEEDKQAIANEIKWCRDNGAQIVIAYIHWGIEYQRTASDAEVKMAKFIADSGADIIFASHPHLLQGIDYFEYQVDYPTDTPYEFESSSWTKKVPVFYSMGNFISNQRKETLGDYTKNAKYTEQGMIADVSFTYVVETGEIKNMSFTAIPTWVEKYNKNGKTSYFIIPLDDELEKNPELAASGHLSRAQSSLQDAIDLLGKEYIYGYWPSDEETAEDTSANDTVSN